jgi:hypothetical protein
VSEQTPLLWNHKRIYSFGAGTQSIAVMVAQAQGLLKNPYDYFVWADVGHDSEDPQVHEYMVNHVMPFCFEYQIPMIRVARTRYGVEETLLDRITRNNKSNPIPLRMRNGRPANRTCTQNFKIDVVNKWIAKQGITHATIGLGFSIDETRRAQNKSMYFHEVKEGFQRRYDFPVLELQFNRFDSINYVIANGLPQPPRSACWFCPFKGRHEWIEDKKHRPEIVQRSAIVEAIINKKIGDGHLYTIHPHNRDRANTLINSIGDQMSLFEETCESGYCGL